MYRRTNRQFNIGLVVAAAVVLLVIGWIVVATRLAAGDIERSRTEGTARFGQLAKARILAQQARTDETLQLIARGDITARRKVVQRPHRRAEHAARRRDRRPRRTVSQKWTASHRKQVEAYKSGDYPAAVAQAIGPDPGRFGRAVRRRRIQPARRDRANARHAARPGVRGGCMAGMESDGDARADGGRRGGGRRRVVAAAQGVPVRDTNAWWRCSSLALAAAGCGSAVAAAVSVTVAPVEPWPAGAQRSHDRAGRGKCGLAIGKPACAPVRSRRRVPCRPVRRWRRSPSVAGSSSASTRTPICSAFGIPPSGQLEGFDIDVAREIARAHLRRSGPHRSAGGQCEPTGIGVAVRRGGPGGPDLLDHL